MTISGFEILNPTVPEITDYHVPSVVSLLNDHQLYSDVFGQLLIIESIIYIE